MIFAGCKSRPLPGVPTPDLQQSSSTGDEGKALVVYDYSKIQTSDWIVTVHAETPVVIEEDPAHGGKSYRVIGDKTTASRISVEGPGGPTGECLTSCEFPALYIVQGKMDLVEEQGKPGCVFSLKISGDFGGKNVEPPGTCPIMNLEDFNCAKLCQTAYDERTVSLDNNNKVITPEAGSGAELDFRVEIKGIKLPGDVDCTWDE